VKKLNGENYEIWVMKIQYVLEEQDVFTVLDHILTEPKKCTTLKHISDSATFESWKKKNFIARITLLNSMETDVMREFRQYEVAKEMWLALKQKFGGTSVTKLRQLTIKFDTYKKRYNHSMRQHLREMSNMISELKDADHILTDEQQIPAVIRSLLHTWEHMKVNLARNEGIKTLNDVVRHLELEEDRIEASKPQGTETTVHLACSSSHGGQGHKRKSNDGKGKGKQEKKI
jgi:gag-polypeptide of LTR copia-type